MPDAVPIITSTPLSECGDLLHAICKIVLNAKEFKRKIK
jgi:hypothetical protein